MLYRVLFISPIALYIALRTERRSLVPLLVFGAAIVTPFYLSYFYAVKLVGASIAALMLYTAPAYVAVASTKLLGEKPHRATFLALCLALTGAGLINMGSGMRINVLGIAVAFMTAILYASYIIGAKKLLLIGIESKAVALVPYLSSVPILALYAFLIEHHVLLDTLTQLAVSLYISFVPTGLAYALYSYGLQTVEASRASILSTVEPVSATVLAWLLLGEPITPAKALGGSLILLSAMIVARVQRG